MSSFLFRTLPNGRVLRLKRCRAQKLSSLLCEKDGCHELKVFVRGRQVRYAFCQAHQREYWRDRQALYRLNRKGT